MKKFVSVFCLQFVAVAMMAATSHVKHVTAIGEVLGDGAKTTAVAIEYDAPILNSSLSAASYTVDGRTVKRVYTNSEAMKSRSPRKGRFVIVKLLRATITRDNICYFIFSNFACNLNYSA